MGSEERARQRIGQSVTESLAMDLEKQSRRITLTQQATNRQASAMELIALTLTSMQQDAVALNDRVRELELSRWAKIKRYLHSVVVRARKDYELSLLRDAGYGEDPPMYQQSSEEVIADGPQGQGEVVEGQGQPGLLNPAQPASDGEPAPAAEQDAREKFADWRERYRGSERLH